MSINLSQDRTDLCTFTFADGRRCKLPQSPEDMGLCYFHAQKFAHARRARAAGVDISHYLNTDMLTACELSSTFSTLFAATAQGFIKPRTATTLAYLGQLMLQTQQLAKLEFEQAFDTSWPAVVRDSICFKDDSSKAPESDTPDSPSSDSPSPQEPASVQPTASLQDNPGPDAQDADPTSAPKVM